MKKNKPIIVRAYKADNSYFEIPFFSDVTDFNIRVSCAKNIIFNSIKNGYIVNSNKNIYVIIDVIRFQFMTKEKINLYV